MPQQAQGKQAAASPRGKVQAVQGSQQSLRAVGAIHQGKGRIARQRCACACFRSCVAFVRRARIGCIAGFAPDSNSWATCGTDVQHAQPFKAGVAVVVKGIVLRAVQGASTSSQWAAVSCAASFARCENGSVVMVSMAAPYGCFWRKASGKGDIQRERQNAKGQGPLLHQPDAGLIIPPAAGGAGQIAREGLHGL